MCESNMKILPQGKHMNGNKHSRKSSLVIRNDTLMPQRDTTDYLLEYLAKKYHFGNCPIFHGI